MREKMTLEKKSDEDTLKLGSIILIIVMLSGYAHFIYKNEYLKSEGTLNDLIFMIILGLIISASLFLKLLYKNGDNNNIKNGEASKIDVTELNENEILKDPSNSGSQNIFDNKTTAYISKIINENRMPDESGKSVFGISSFQKTKTKTQLAILLSLIKEDLFKDEYAGIGVKIFIDAFFDKIEAEPITEAFFGQIRSEIILYGKNKVFIGIDENSKHYDLYIKFKEILLAEIT